MDYIYRDGVDSDKETVLDIYKECFGYYPSDSKTDGRCYVAEWD